MNEYEKGYRDGYAQGTKNASTQRGPGQGRPMPNRITLESNYPDKELDWTDVQIYRIDYTAGPPSYWCVAQPATSKRNQRGHRTRIWDVLSSHSTQDRATSARAATGRGVGAG